MLTLDLKGNMPGRGAYLCKGVSHADQKSLKKQLERAFRGALAGGAVEELVAASVSNAPLPTARGQNG
jgi:predicted RNA-binding protein YlxR (DUF448 family)